MQGHPRSTRQSPASYPSRGRPMIDFDEFEIEAQSNREMNVLNVSPYRARIEIATVPGTRPRRFMLEPGESMYLQHGYCVPFLTATRKEAPPWIETHTEIEAWPGERYYDANDSKYKWRVSPGPRLPQVVSEDRARAVAVQWEQALAQRDRDATAPLKLRFERTDGTKVEVEADVDPVPMRGRAAAAPPVIDEEDQSAPGNDEPPPDDDTPPEPEIPVVSASGAVTTAAPDKPERRRGGR